MADSLLLYPLDGVGRAQPLSEDAGMIPSQLTPSAASPPDPEYCMHPNASVL